VALGAKLLDSSSGRMNSNPVLESIIYMTSTNRRGVNKEVVMPLEIVIVIVIV
jgi:hypothetical protein